MTSSMTEAMTEEEVCLETEDILTERFLLARCRIEQIAGRSEEENRCGEERGYGEKKAFEEAVGGYKGEWYLLYHYAEV